MIDRSMAGPRGRAPAVALLLTAPLSLAQQSVIDHCRKTPSDADRIACLEAATVDLRTWRIEGVSKRHEFQSPTRIGWSTNHNGRNSSSITPSSTSRARGPISQAA
jgi:hypothetical protein